MKQLLQTHCELRLHDGSRAIGLLIHFANGLVGLQHAGIDSTNGFDSGEFIYFPLTSISWIRPIQMATEPPAPE